MIERHPTESWPWLALAEVRTADGDEEDAADAVAQAVSLDPDDDDVALSAADALVNLGRFAEAEEQLHRLRASVSGDAARVVSGRRAGILGRIRDGLDDVAAAELLFEQAVELLPEYDYHWYLLGDLHLRRGRLARARAVAGEGLERFPDDPYLLDLRDEIAHASSSRTAGEVTSTPTARGAKVSWSSLKRS